MNEISHTAKNPTPFRQTAMKIQVSKISDLWTSQTIYGLHKVKIRIYLIRTCVKAEIPIKIGIYRALIHQNTWKSVRFTIWTMRFTKKLIVIKVTNEFNNSVPFVRCAPNSLGDIAVCSFGQNPWPQKGPILRRYHAPNRPSMEGKDLSPDFVFCTKWNFYSRAIRRYAYLDQGVSEQKVPSVWTIFRHKLGKNPWRPNLRQWVERFLKFQFRFSST